MVSAISNATQAQPAAQTKSTAAAKPAESKPQPAKTGGHGGGGGGGGDTVQISAAAQALLDAMKEATETPVQTAKEAGNGDPEAQRLLTRQADARKAAAK